MTDRGIYLDSIHRYEIGYFDDNEFSLFQNRILFPVYDEFGTLVSYQGRSVLDYKELGISKFYHSTYDKSNVLYGLFQCADRICSHNYAVVTEGPFDTIILAQLGIPSVCIMGSATTVGQAEILARYTERALIWVDSDKAGKEASKLAVERFTAAGIRVENMVTNSKDANDYYLENGPINTQTLVLQNFRRFL